MRRVSDDSLAGVYDQSEFDIRFGWGLTALQQFAPLSDVVIVVDVLSFSTSVEIATQRGAVIFPYRGRGPDAGTFARHHGAELASFDRTGGGFSLAPASLQSIPAGTRLVLPSPNGANLSLGVGQVPTLAGCLRNCAAVAKATDQFGGKIAVLGAGERWREDQTLRPAFEDLFGAGAVISYLSGRRSPEAFAAEAVFLAGRNQAHDLLTGSASGKELLARNSAADVELAAMVNISNCVPLLQSGAYSNISPV